MAGFPKPPTRDAAIWALEKNQAGQVHLGLEKKPGPPSEPSSFFSEGPLVSFQGPPAIYWAPRATLQSFLPRPIRVHWFLFKAQIGMPGLVFSKAQIAALVDWL